MKLPLFLVNFKAYPQATGKNAVLLAKKCQRVAKKLNISIIPCVQAADISLVAHKVSIPVFAQHVDTAPGAHTGNIVLTSVISAGAKGTLLNHAERTLSFSTIKQTVAECKKIRFPVVVCASTPKEAKRMASLKPFAVAIEPPELIGTGISVSRANPGIIKKSVALKVPVLCGAGISSKEDVAKALELGAKGVLVASAVVLSGHQEKTIYLLGLGIKNYSCLTSI
ncbi:triose-phosphate isomerase [Candidatus Woesearchaeota archaeon]|nr:triose-phosphate isomerase [Candidatus Woesearchaeota archaeon]